MISREELAEIAATEIKAFPMAQWGLPEPDDGWEAAWILVLADKIADAILSSPLIPAGVQMGQDGSVSYAAIQFTGENSQGVKDFLGTSYEGMRGGLQEDDPLVIWFNTGPASQGLITSNVRPTEWVVKFTDAGGFTRLDSLTHETYQRLYGR